MAPFGGETMIDGQIRLPNSSDTRTTIDQAPNVVRIIVGKGGETEGNLYEKGPEGKWIAQLFICLPGVAPIILSVDQQIKSGLRKVWSE